MADAEGRFRLLYQKAPVPLHSVNERLRLVEVNESWLDLLGYERHEVLDQPIASFMTDESARRYFELGPPAFLRREAIKDLEPRFVTKRSEERNDIFSARA